MPPPNPVFASTMERIVKELFREFGHPFPGNTIKNGAKEHNTRRSEQLKELAAKYFSTPKDIEKAIRCEAAYRCKMKSVLELSIGNTTDDTQVHTTMEKESEPLSNDTSFPSNDFDDIDFSHGGHDLLDGVITPGGRVEQVSAFDLFNNDISSIDNNSRLNDLSNDSGAGAIKRPTTSTPQGSPKRRKVAENEKDHESEGNSEYDDKDEHNLVESFYMFHMNNENGETIDRNPTLNENVFKASFYAGLNDTVAETFDTSSSLHVSELSVSLTRQNPLEASQHSAQEIQSLVITNTSSSTSSIISTMERRANLENSTFLQINTAVQLSDELLTNSATSNNISDANQSSTTLQKALEQRDIRKIELETRELEKQIMIKTKEQQFWRDYFEKNE